MEPAPAPTALAGLHQRLFALLFDYVAVVVVLKLADQVALGAHWDLAPQPGLFAGRPGLWALAGLALLLFRDLPAGRSLGKWLTGIAVRRADDPVRAPGPTAVALRNLALLLLPVEGVLVFLDPHCRRLGDRLAGTVVVTLPRPAPLARRLLLLSSLFLGFVLVALLVTPWNMRRSAAYQTAHRAALEAPAVARAVGRPVTLDPSPAFELHRAGSQGGRATVTFQAEGPAGKATARVELRLRTAPRRWEVVAVDVTARGAPPLVRPAPQQTPQTEAPER